MSNVLPDIEQYILGRVLRVQDGIVWSSILEELRVGDLVQIVGVTIGKEAIGIIFDISNDDAKVVLIHGTAAAGDNVLRADGGLQTRSGSGVLGQIITPFGEMLIVDAIGEWEFFFRSNYCMVAIDIESEVPGVTWREPVRVPFETGIVTIDCFFPIGRGQRELIIGDNKSGKTVLGLSALINQKRMHAHDIWEALTPIPQEDTQRFTPCIYVAIGQRRAEIVRVHRTLCRFGVMFYTCIVYTACETMASIQYLAPYAGSAIAEWFMSKGFHAVVVHDDLTQHAIAYRQLSLLLRRPPAREAYPADIFYLHARLLERAAQITLRVGAGSVTALPIIETQLGDITTYISTNVISITDGQLFLSRKIANNGRRPSIDLGLSVSRVGSAAQMLLVAQLSKRVKIIYVLYRRYKTLERLGNELPTIIRIALARGNRLDRFMTQRTYYTYDLLTMCVGLAVLTAPIADSLEMQQLIVLVRFIGMLLYALLFTPSVYSILRLRSIADAVLTSIGITCWEHVVTTLVDTILHITDIVTTNV